MQSRCKELEKRPSDIQVAEAQKINQELQSRCNELEKRPSNTQVAEVQRVIKDLREELKKRPSEIEAAEAQRMNEELQNLCNAFDKWPTESQEAKAQDTLQALQRRCDELEKRPVEAEAKLLTLRAEMKHLQDRVKKEKLQPNKAASEASRLRQNLQTVQGELDDLKKEFTGKQSALEADLVAVRSALKESQLCEAEAVKKYEKSYDDWVDSQLDVAELKEINKELQDQFQEIPAMEEKIKMLDEQLQEIPATEEKIKKLEEQLQEIPATKEKIKKLEEQLQEHSAVRTDLANLQTRFTKLEKEHAETDQANRRLTQTSKTMQDDLAARESDFQELHKTNKIQKEQFAKSEKDLLESQRKVTVNESHIKVQDETISSQKEQISELKGRLQKRDQVAKDCQQKSSESKAALKLLKKEKADLETRIGKVREEVTKKGLSILNLQLENDDLSTERDNLKEDHDKLKKEKADGDSTFEKLKDEFDRLKKDHRRVCNSLTKLRGVHAKCPTEAPTRSEKGPHASTSESLKPSAEETKDLVKAEGEKQLDDGESLNCSEQGLDALTSQPLKPSAEETEDLVNVEGEKQLDDGESFADDASQAMNEAPLDSQLHDAWENMSQGMFGGASDSSDAVSRNFAYEDEPSASANGDTASPIPLGGDAPSAPANGGAAEPGSTGGDDHEAPASSEGVGAPETIPTPGTGLLTPQKFQVCLSEAFLLRFRFSVVVIKTFAGTKYDRMVELTLIASIVPILLPDVIKHHCSLHHPCNCFHLVLFRLRPSFSRGLRRRLDPCRRYNPGDAPVAAYGWRDWDHLACLVESDHG